MIIHQAQIHKIGQDPIEIVGIDLIEINFIQAQVIEVETGDISLDNFASDLRKGASRIELMAKPVFGIKKIFVGAVEKILFQ